MNRIIKFRAWNTLHKKMIPMFHLGMGVFNEKNREVDNIVLMQFTGLHDKNGKKIYEGDIVKAKNLDDGLYDVGIVVYGDKGSFCLYFPNVGTGIRTPLLNYIQGMMIFTYDMEVIGNEFENA